MRFIAFALFAACPLLLARSVDAATTLTEWGTLATASSYTCSSDFCGADTVPELLALTTTLAVDASDGGDNVTSAAVSLGGAYPAPGFASGAATAAGGLGVPVLRAGAASDTSGWISGQALAVQAYEYTGPGETLSLTWNLTGSVNNPDADTLTGLVVFAGFFSQAELPAFPEVDPSDPSATAFLLATLALVSPDDNFLEFTATNANVVESGNISIDVTNGEEFYLAMGLMAGAGGSNATAESLSTLVADFDGAPLLTPAFTSVPLPGAAWLLGSALIGLMSVRARRGATP
ncbi:MAG: hypothetical protein RLW61_17675 [Gammaproteobacteria bacterium]